MCALGKMEDVETLSGETEDGERGRETEPDAVTGAFDAMTVVARGRTTTRMTRRRAGARRAMDDGMTQVVVP